MSESDPSELDYDSWETVCLPPVDPDVEGVASSTSGRPAGHCNCELKIQSLTSREFFPITTMFLSTDNKPLEMIDMEIIVEFYLCI